jgi:tetratricopeptide (TPR) repeat protein
MLAIPIWEGDKPIAKKLPWTTLRRFYVSQQFLKIFFPAFVCLMLFVDSNAFAETPSNQTPSDFAALARKTYMESRVQYQRDTNNLNAAWQYARACFDLGEFAATSRDRAEIADTGIAISMDLVKRAPQLAEAHYYLAMNLGQLARTKSLGALKLVDQMEVEFLAAAKLKEHFDYAGPDRNLGQLYLEAPSFASIGSRTKARQHLRRAVELEPDYPENRLLLAEAYLRWGDKVPAAKELKALLQGWDAARKRLSGGSWGASWSDWEARLAKLKDKLQETLKELETTRQKN